MGDQQKELVLEISQQLSRHNEVLERAVEKQVRMEDKVANIEEQLRKKPVIGYDRKREKLEAIKKLHLEQKKKAEASKYLPSLISTLDIDFDEDGFASCEEDEEVIKARST